MQPRPVQAEAAPLSAEAEVAVLPPSAEVEAAVLPPAAAAGVAQPPSEEEVAQG